MATESDIGYLKRALDLAEKGLYSTDPNPRVGCVIVRDGEIVGEGWHQYIGGPHAEIVALKQSGARSKNATAYTSLEPCAYHGLTGPCSKALISAGIKRVVSAAIDPSPKVSGKGFDDLEAAGIETIRNVLPKDAEALNPGYWKRLNAGLPWVRLKMAATLDGRTATASAESQWLTGRLAREDVQYWRARSSAIITGSGTVIADDPALTVRASQFVAEHPGWPNGLRQPIRAVIDRRAQINASSKVFQSPGKALWFTGQPPSDPSPDTEVLLAPDWQPQEIIKLLANDYQCNEVLIEAGAQLAGSFLQSGVVDEMILYQAPALLGQDARPLVTLSGIQNLADKLELEIKELSQIGGDIRIIAKPIPSR